MDLHIKYNKILKKTYGYESLKPDQFTIINTVINEKKDVLAILATGFGKSICYQMPYLITKKCVIVVSPLIALMKDQTEELKKLKVPVAILNSTCKNKEEVMDDILAGNNKIIYITPEYMENCEAFINMLVENDQLCLIAIDEAHCVSTWGLDFRKSYTELKQIRDWIDSSVPILALTATASKKVRKDIIKILQLEEPDIIVGDFDRKNLYMTVQKRSKDPHNDIYDLLQKYKDDYKIIYCKTREETEKLSENINKWGFECMAYHAGIPAKKRDELQQKFIDGQVKTMCATIAFGMGINIKSVRLVIHYNCPKNIESYYQEIGRAGRDGLPSECHLFYAKKDFIINKLFLDGIKDPKHKAYQEEQINMIEKFVYSASCRRSVILKSFDETYNKSECDNCDNCCKVKNKVEENKKDYSIAIYLILELISKLNGSYGVNTYINILRGSKAKNITLFMQNLPFYNIGKSHSVEWFKDLFNAIQCDDYLNEKPIKFSMGSVVECTKKAKDWLKIIKEKYNSIKDFDSDIKINTEDQLLITESQLMKNIGTKTKSKVKDNIFTDDILDRLNVSLDDE
jgi:RecQ family ATP-dependent DNA helicase